MGIRIHAACGCNTGKIRKTNEDNFFFDGKCLERDHDGLTNPAVLEQPIRKGCAVAVFDGMGGERYGEYASHAAARHMQATERKLSDYFVSERRYLMRLAHELDEKVGALQAEMQTEHIGTTFVGLQFGYRYAYVCNVGDSRAYRLRDGEFLQLSVDHVEKHSGSRRSKSPLTQYLGFGSEEIEIEPYIAKGEIKKGDVYLLCSDGLTDMLSNFEISDILLNCDDPELCVRKLIHAANEHGGRDNITVIVCKLI